MVVASTILFLYVAVRRNSQVVCHRITLRFFTAPSTSTISNNNDAPPTKDIIVKEKHIAVCT